jgi:hypothetical protein
VTAAAINNWGDIAGFYASAGGTHGFLRAGDGSVITLDVPGSSMTQALGVDDEGDVVGVYTAGTGNNPPIHGLTWDGLRGFQTADDPHAIGTTTINGVDDLGQLVGFYVDGHNDTNGLLATPRR